MRQFSIAEYRAQDVVEIVCDAAGQCADGLHFLRLSQLYFQTFLFQLCLLLRADVDCGSNEAIRLTIRIVANIYYSQPLIGLIAPAVGILPGMAGLIVALTQLGYGAGLLFLVPLSDVL